MLDNRPPHQWSFDALGKCVRENPEEWERLRAEYPDWRPDLYGQDFSKCDLTGRDFASCILYDCDFSLAGLRAANFSKCIAERAKFRGAWLLNANFQGASLRQATLDFAELSDANFEEADLYAASLQGANLYRARLRGADLRYVLFSNSARTVVANLAEADLRATKLMTATDGGANTVRQAERISAINPEFEFNQPFSGPDFVAGSMLELTTANGLESARFDTPTAFLEYVDAAFRYATTLGPVARKTAADEIDTALARIQCLRRFYQQLGQIPESLIRASAIAGEELIKYLANHPSKLHVIKPRQFEELIADVLFSFGWKIELTKATRDGGYDIFAVSPLAAGLSTSWIIECKKYSPENKVGLALVRSLYGLKSDLRIANALLATTSTFTRDAGLYAAGRYDLHLRDFNDIVEWLRLAVPAVDPVGRHRIDKKESDGGLTHRTLLPHPPTR